MALPSVSSMPLLNPSLVFLFFVGWIVVMMAPSTSSWSSHALTLRGQSYDVLQSIPLIEDTLIEDCEFQNGVIFLIDEGTPPAIQLTMRRCYVRNRDVQLRPATSLRHPLPLSTDARVAFVDNSWTALVLISLLCAGCRYNISGNRFTEVPMWKASRLVIGSGGSSFSDDAVLTVANNTFAVSFSHATSALGGCPWTDHTYNTILVASGTQFTTGASLLFDGNVIRPHDVPDSSTSTCLGIKPVRQGTGLLVESAVLFTDDSALTITNNDVRMAMGGVVGVNVQALFTAASLSFSVPTDANTDASIAIDPRIGTIFQRVRIGSLPLAAPSLKINLFTTFAFEVDAILFDIEAANLQFTVDEVRSDTKMDLRFVEFGVHTHIESSLSIDFGDKSERSVAVSFANGARVGRELSITNALSVDMDGVRVSGGAWIWATSGVKANPNATVPIMTFVRVASSTFGATIQIQNVVFAAVASPPSISSGGVTIYNTSVPNVVISGVVFRPGASLAIRDSVMSMPLVFESHRVDISQSEFQGQNPIILDGNVFRTPRSRVRYDARCKSQYASALDVAIFHSYVFIGPQSDLRFTRNTVVPCGSPADMGCPGDTGLAPLSASLRVTDTTLLRDATITIAWNNFSSLGVKGGEADVVLTAHLTRARMDLGSQRSFPLGLILSQPTEFTRPPKEPDNSMSCSRIVLPNSLISSRKVMLAPQTLMLDFVALDGKTVSDKLLLGGTADALSFDWNRVNASSLETIVFQASQDAAAGGFQADTVSFSNMESVKRMHTAARDSADDDDDASSSQSSSLLLPSPASLLVPTAAVMTARVLTIVNLVNLSEFVFHRCVIASLSIPFTRSLRRLYVTASTVGDGTGNMLVVAGPVSPGRPWPPADVTKTYYSPPTSPTSVTPLPASGTVDLSLDVILADNIFSSVSMSYSVFQGPSSRLLLSNNNFTNTDELSRHRLNLHHLAFASGAHLVIVGNRFTSPFSSAQGQKGCAISSSANHAPNPTSYSSIFLAFVFVANYGSSTCIVDNIINAMPNPRTDNSCGMLYAVREGIGIAVSESCTVTTNASLTIGRNTILQGLTGKIAAAITPLMRDGATIVLLLDRGGEKNNNDTMSLDAAFVLSAAASRVFRSPVVTSMPILQLSFANVSDWRVPQLRFVGRFDSITLNWMPVTTGATSSSRHALTGSAPVNSTSSLSTSFTLILDGVDCLNAISVTRPPSSFSLHILQSSLRGQTSLSTVATISLITAVNSTVNVLIVSGTNRVLTASAAGSMVAAGIFLDRSVIKCSLMLYYLRFPSGSGVVIRESRFGTNTQDDIEHCFQRVTLYGMIWEPGAFLLFEKNSIVTPFSYVCNDTAQGSTNPHESPTVLFWYCFTSDVHSEGGDVAAGTDSSIAWIIIRENNVSSPPRIRTKTDYCRTGIIPTPLGVIIDVAYTSSLIHAAVSITGNILLGGNTGAAAIDLSANVSSLDIVGNVADKDIRFTASRYLPARVSVVGNLLPRVNLISSSRAASSYGGPWSPTSSESPKADRVIACNWVNVTPSAANAAVGFKVSSSSSDAAENFTLNQECDDDLPASFHDCGQQMKLRLPAGDVRSLADWTPVDVEAEEPACRAPVTSSPSVSVPPTPQAIVLTNDPDDQLSMAPGIACSDAFESSQVSGGPRRPTITPSTMHPHNNNRRSTTRTTGIPILPVPLLSPKPQKSRSQSDFHGRRRQRSRSVLSLTPGRQVRSTANTTGAPPAPAPPARKRRSSVSATVVKAPIISTTAEPPSLFTVAAEAVSTQATTVAVSTTLAVGALSGGAAAAGDAQSAAMLRQFSCASRGSGATTLGKALVPVAIGEGPSGVLLGYSAIVGGVAAAQGLVMLLHRIQGTREERFSQLARARAPSITIRVAQLSVPGISMAAWSIVFTLLGANAAGLGVAPQGAAPLGVLWLGLMVGLQVYVMRVAHKALFRGVRPPQEEDSSGSPGDVVIANWTCYERLWASPLSSGVPSVIRTWFAPTGFWLTSEFQLKHSACFAAFRPASTRLRAAVPALLLLQLWLFAAVGAVDVPRLLGPERCWLQYGAASVLLFGRAGLVAVLRPFRSPIVNTVAPLVSAMVGGGSLLLAAGRRDASASLTAASMSLSTLLTVAAVGAAIFERLFMRKRWKQIEATRDDGIGLLRSEEEDARPEASGATSCLASSPGAPSVEMDEMKNPPRSRHEVGVEAIATPVGAPLLPPPAASLPVPVTVPTAAAVHSLSRRNPLNHQKPIALPPPIL